MGYTSVLRRKKTEMVRFFIDYRKLNTMTINDSYPLPRMDECIDTLGDADIFTALDTFNIYWHIDIPKEDRGKNFFVCHASQFQYIAFPSVSPMTQQLFNVD